MAAERAKTLSGSDAYADSLQSRIAEIRDDIASLTDAVNRYGADRAGSYGKAAKSASDDLVAAARRVLHVAGSELSATDSMVKRRVASRPYEVIGLAVCAGLALGFLLRR